MDDEQLEDLIERFEEIYKSMQERIEKLEKQQDEAAKSAPYHIGMPMIVSAQRPRAGFGWQWEKDIPRVEPRL
jgi:hypothetical protein